MILNILYSLFFHLIIILIVYLNFNFREIPESENKPSLTVSFIVKSGNSENVTNQVLKTVKEPDKEVKKEAKKLITPKKKDDQKKVKKVRQKKPDLNDLKVKNTKAVSKPPEEVIKPAKRLAPPTEKKEPIKLVKKEQAPKIIKEVKEEVEEVEDEEEQEEAVEDKVVNSNDFEDKQKLENIDLSVREKFNVQLQIKRCYKRAIEEAKKDSPAVVNIHIIIDQDGTIDLDLATIENYEKYSDPKEIDFHIAVDNARRALTLCSPLRNLPEDKYEIWRELNLQFDNNDANFNP